MSETEKKATEPKAPISFESIGGRCVLEASEVKAEKPIDFSSIGGKCVLGSSFWTDTGEPKPAESVEKEGDAHK
jgi:hypothetical protein